MIPDTTPGAAKGAIRKENAFKWQAATASEAERIRAFGFHTEAAVLIIPEDARNSPKF